MNVLVIDQSVPRPHHNAGDRAISDLVSGLVDLGHNVAFYPDRFPEGYDADTMIPDVDPAVVERLVGHVGEGPEGLEEWFEANPPDLAIVSRPGTGALYLDLLETNPATARVLFGHDLHAARMERGVSFGASMGRPAILAMTAVERRCWRHYDVPIYPSQNEADHVDRVLGTPGRALAVPIYRLSEGPAPSPEGRSGCAFVGAAAHAPNDDAVAWFGATILPLIRRDLPETTLTVIGDWPAHRRHELDGVTYTGMLDDAELESLMSKVRVSVAPVRWGAGVKRKVVAAMHRGIPVVSTSVGLEGVGVTTPDGRPRVIEADNAEDFAAGVTHLCTDDDAWRTLSAASHSSITDQYGDEAYLQAMVGFLELAVDRSRERT